MWKARTFSTLEVKLDLLGEKRGRQSFVGVKMLIEEFIKGMEEQDMIRKVQSWESSLEIMFLQSVWSRVPKQVVLTQDVPLVIRSC